MLETLLIARSVLHAPRDTRRLHQTPKPTSLQTLTRLLSRFLTPPTL
jgi:hypothetical protein